MFIPTLFMLIFPICLIWAAYTDLTSYLIPNRISLILVAAFFPVALLMKLEWQDIGWHMATGVGMLIIGIGLFMARMFGGGDAKLMAAASLWLGHESLLYFVVYVAMFGGALAVVLLGARHTVFHQGWKKPQWLTNLLEPKSGIPYGIAIALGALFAFDHSDLYLAFTKLLAAV